MKTYIVKWTETLYFEEEVEAPDEQKAKETAHDQVYGRDEFASGDDVFQSAYDSDLSVSDVTEIEQNGTRN